MVEGVAHGVKAVALDWVLRFWFIEAKKPWPENPTSASRWQTIDDRVLLCVEEVLRASTSSHLSCHFDGFMVHRDVPPVTSSRQFLDDLATHLRITTGFTTPFDLKKHFSFALLLVCTAQQTRWLVPHAAQDDLGEGVVLGPCHGAGVHDGLVVGGSPCREGGAWSGSDRFRDPERCGQPLILTVMQDLGVVCPCNGCCFELS